MASRFGVSSATLNPAKRSPGNTSSSAARTVKMCVHDESNANNRLCDRRRRLIFTVRGRCASKRSALARNRVKRGADWSMPKGMGLNTFPR